MEKFLRKVNRKTEHPAKLARKQVKIQKQNISKPVKEEVKKEMKPKIEIIKP